MSQGFKDARGFQRFLDTHGKKGYKVLAYVDDYAPCDAVMVSPMGRISYVELKERRISIDAYPDCSVDSYKIHALQRLAQDSGSKVFLVALYPASGKVAIWEIREDEEYATTQMMANAKTVQFNGPTPRKQKTMVKLLLRDAVIKNHTFL